MNKKETIEAIKALIGLSSETAATVSDTKMVDEMAEKTAEADPMAELVAKYDELKSMVDDLAARIAALEGAGMDDVAMSKQEDINKKMFSAIEAISSDLEAIKVTPANTVEMSKEILSEKHETNTLKGIRMAIKNNLIQSSVK